MIPKRSTRLRELFLQAVNRALKELKDPGLAGFITVTDLVLSADSKSARVYYSMLGSHRDREKTQRALDRAVGFLRRELYNRLRIKYVPKLSFVFDETPESAQRIETLLDRLDSGDARAEDPQAEPPRGGVPTKLDSAPDAEAPPKGVRHRVPSRLDSVASRGSRRSRKRRR